MKDVVVVDIESSPLPLMVNGIGGVYVLVIDTPPPPTQEYLLKRLAVYCHNDKWKDAPRKCR